MTFSLLLFCRNVLGIEGEGWRSLMQIATEMHSALFKTPYSAQKIFPLLRAKINSEAH